MPANYNKIAKIYDCSSRLVFGKNIVNAQVALLKYIPANCTILIAGGGTGWILEELTKQHKATLKIDYVDVSAEMIALSQKRNYGLNKTNFITKPVETFKGEALYDVIITPFVMDNFNAVNISKAFKNLDMQLKAGGLWLYADFVYENDKNPFWQKLLLKIMYLFFKITCNIETKELINMRYYFNRGYKKISEAGYYFQFIKAIVYRKI